MRRRPLLAIPMIGAVALATVATTAPAFAETEVGPGLVFYGEADFGVEDAGYPAGVDWFFGDVNGTPGTYEFTPAGLEITSTGANTQVQILNQDVSITSTTGGSSALINAIDSAPSVESDGSGWTFQLPLFYNGQAGFTTLRPAVAGGISESTENWISSQAIPAAGGEPAIPANTPTPLVDILANLDEQTDWTLLAYGLIVDNADTTIHWVEFDATVNFFSPVPAAVAAPASLTAEEASEGGIALSATGLTPDVEVSFFILPPGVTDINDPSVVVVPDNGVTSGPDGSVAALYEPADELAVGIYTVVVLGENWIGSLYFAGAPVETTFEITAPELAATGVDALPLGAGALGVLLLGAGALAVVRIRRSATRG